ncbi:MAG: hypothetical protein LPK11_07790 [Chromatiaceae bacterium]|uniref:hypothetical protein n=1 Tax=Rheinheimera fenheensis TaxID=3152295 RepID=UPI0029CFE233|nr:hypothetical protein [Chromatiaceae bacterium]
MDFDNKKYKVMKLPHPVLLHWVLNPGLAFNELILGQRVPKMTLIDKTSDAPLIERQYIPCPHCGSIHSDKLWSKPAAFKNWFGLFCPTCEKAIPCLWNLTSLVVLFITFPIWGWFRRSLESKWLSVKREQHFKCEDVEPKTVKANDWLKMGLVYGFLMFCVMTLPDIVRGEATSKHIAFAIVTWLIAGLLFGGVMKFILGRGKRKDQ